jgi:hypothetical protein
MNPWTFTIDTKWEHPSHLRIWRSVQGVCQLARSSGLDFEERGEHELRGTPGTWALLALSSVRD